MEFDGGISLMGIGGKAGEQVGNRMVGEHTRVQEDWEICFDSAAFSHRTIPPLPPSSPFVRRR